MFSFSVFLFRSPNKQNKIMAHSSRHQSTTNQLVITQQRMDGDLHTVSLRPDHCGDDVCGVDGAPEREPHGKSALHDVLGSDDGRIRGGYLQVQYRVRGLAQVAAASDDADEQSPGLEVGGGALEESIRALELVAQEGDEEEKDDDDDKDDESSVVVDQDLVDQGTGRGAKTTTVGKPEVVGAHLEVEGGGGRRTWDKDEDDVD